MSSRFPTRIARGHALRATLPLLLALFAILLFVRPLLFAGRTQVRPAESEPLVRVEASPQLFATMCALSVAGYQAPPGSGAASIAAALHKTLAKRQGPAIDAVRNFYQEHQIGDSSEPVSRYISFGLVIGEPPKFDFVMARTELPPDVLPLEDFRALLENFYQEQHIDQLWARVRPEYTRLSDQFAGPIFQLLRVTAGYLREVPSSRGPRSFIVYMEPLVGDFANFRLYGDKYAVVVGSGSPGESDARLDKVRHAFLHFLLDPLPARYESVVADKLPLLDNANRAPHLPEAYRNDFFSLTTECLVRAVELRLRRLPAARLEAALVAEDREGFLLVRPLYQRLLAFDHSEPSMSRYFPELIKHIDLQAEQIREQKVQFNTGEVTRASVQDEASELTRWLDEGDRQIASQDAAGAASTFERVLAKYPGNPRAVYGLAVASVLQGKAEQARQLFQRVVATRAGRNESASAADPNEPGILAWSHVYLGRMADLEGSREQALQEYNAALAVSGAPEAARAAAQRGLEKSYTIPAKSKQGDPPRP